MGAPYASLALSHHALSALWIALLALYRGELYRLPASAWALSAAVGFLGLFAPLCLSARLRARLLTGLWPLVIFFPFVAFFLGPVLVPSPLTVGPFFFCAGASFTTCVLVLWNTSRRRRSLRRLLDHAGAPDPGVRARLETYFAAETPLVEESLRRSKALQRALRAQAWFPRTSRRARAAALLRDFAAFLERSCEAERAIPLPSEALRAHADACRASSERVGAAFLGGAAQLENGGRIFRWRSWLTSASAAGVDADRDWFYALDRLAKRHRVTRPGWVRRCRRMLAYAPLTVADVAPPSNVAAPLAKPVTVAVAVIVLANVLLSTATAQTPLDDSRPLPVLAGASGESRIEPRLSRVVSSLAGRRADVRCWSGEEWERLTFQRALWNRRSRVGAWGGYVSKDHERVNLAPAACASLARLAYSRIPVEKDAWPDALAWSVRLLAHEAQHVRGIANEAMAECYGMQSISIAAQMLGRTAKEGRYLAYLFWERMYHQRRDQDYVSEECKNGGGLDLRPQVDLWP